jgi:peptidyl-tRNA hydrolase
MPSPDEPATEERVLWLYVVTRADHAPEVQAVQLGHACSECVLPEQAPLRKDTRLCWLQARDQAELAEYVAELERKGVPHAVVRETDGPHAGELTALACAPTLQRSKLRKIFHHPPLAKLAAPTRETA